MKLSRKEISSIVLTLVTAGVVAAPIALWLIGLSQGEQGIAAIDAGASSLAHSTRETVEGIAGLLITFSPELLALVILVLAAHAATKKSEFIACGIVAFLLMLVECLLIGGFAFLAMLFSSNLSGWAMVLAVAALSAISLIAYTIAAVRRLRAIKRGR